MKFSVPMINVYLVTQVARFHLNRFTITVAGRCFNIAFMFKLLTATVCDKDAHIYEAGQMIVVENSHRKDPQ